MLPRLNFLHSKHFLVGRLTFLVISGLCSLESIIELYREVFVMIIRCIPSDVERYEIENYDNVWIQSQSKKKMFLSVRSLILQDWPASSSEERNLVKWKILLYMKRESNTQIHERKKYWDLLSRTSKLNVKTYSLFVLQGSDTWVAPKCLLGTFKMTLDI